MDTGEGEASHAFDRESLKRSIKKPTEYSTMDTGEGEASHAFDINPGDNDKRLITQIAIDINPGDNDERLIAQTDGEINKSKNDLIQNGRCIYRLPEGFKKLDVEYLEPQVVAIGPYHRNKLETMEEVKRRSVGYFLRAKGRNVEDFVGKCLKQIRPLEPELKKCCSSPETINIPTDEFLKMMFVDGCFILYLFLNFEREDTSGHPPFWLKNQERVTLPKIYADLLLLENQIPSIVLEELYKILSEPGDDSLTNIATKVFKRLMMIIDPINRNRPRPGWLHLLDLVRSLFIPRGHYERLARMFAIFSPKLPRAGIFSPTPCVTKLRRAGIKIKSERQDSFLEVKFKGGVIEMPFIALDHEMCSFLVNCVAFEQCHRCSTHFSIYATFLDGLVNTHKDIDYLCDRRIIANSFSTDEKAAEFINNLGRQALTIYKDYDNNNYYLFELSRDVNRYYYRKRMHWGKWQWMNFKHEYFGKPWMLISAFVAFVLLALTFLQTFYTMYAYHVHPKN